MFLNAFLGLNPPLDVTGVFGDETFDAVKQFQLAYSENVLLPWGENGPIPPTGYVYLTTRRMINILMCPTAFLPLPPLVADLSI